MEPQFNEPKPIETNKYGSLIATVGGILTSLGAVWVVFVDPINSPLWFKMLVVALPVIGGGLSKIR